MFWQTAATARWQMVCEALPRLGIVGNVRTWATEEAAATEARIADAHVRRDTGSVPMAEHPAVCNEHESVLRDDPK
jgi:hypothetical protein